MSKLQAQSEESKFIKRTNEAMKNLYSFIPSEDNNYLAAWHNAMKESQLDISFNVVNGEKVPVIRNTKENREKIEAFRHKMNEFNVMTLKDIRNEAIQELKEAGRKVTPTNVRKQLKVRADYATLENNLDFIYGEERKGNYQYSHLSDALRGLSRKADPKEHARRVGEIADEIIRVRKQERKRTVSKILLDPKNPY